MSRILVLDDDAELLSTLEQVLVEAGHEVSCALDGLRGERLLRDEVFDLVITDIFMPNKDGLELIMNLNRGSSNIGILAISGDAQLSATCLDLAERTGAHQTLSKPFSAHQLLEAVESALRRSKFY